METVPTDVKEILKEKIQAGTKIRKEIQEVHRKRYEELKRLFRAVTETNPQLLKFLTDMFYYRNGGYPSENSLPKHEEVLNRFIDIFKYMSFLGTEKQFVTNYLAEHGIEVKLLHPVEDYSVEKSHKAIAEANVFLEKFTFKEFLNTLIDECLGLQGHICNLADKIKIDLAKEIEKESGVKKGHYLDAVTFNYNAEKDAGATAQQIDVRTTRKKTNVTGVKRSFDMVTDVKLEKLEEIKHTSA
jgi:hypothetical protein